MKIINCRYKAIRTIDLKDMKVNEKSYFQLIDDGYFVICSNCMSDIHSKSDRILCEIIGCDYVICLNISIHKIIENLNYSIHCVK